MKRIKGSLETEAPPRPLAFVRWLEALAEFVDELGAGMLLGFRAAAWLVFVGLGFAIPILLVWLAAAWILERAAA